MYKILIVDDELVFRRGIHAILQKSDFCIGKIAEAVDGCQAMEILLHDTYDIVITDIRMPRMDGLMLCRSIREQKMHPAIVITQVTMTLSTRRLLYNTAYPTIY